MQASGWLDAGLLWRAVPAVVLAWLAVFFGGTLRPGQVPLIERIARVRDPCMTPALCRYTRRLTAVWSAYFVVAACLSFAFGQSMVSTGAFIWVGTIVLFVGEHWLRPRVFFPGAAFPTLLQQLRDTTSVWGIGKRSSH